jgi:hypothetical protein
LGKLSTRRPDTPVLIAATGGVGGDLDATAANALADLAGGQVACLVDH